MEETVETLVEETGGVSSALSSGRSRSRLRISPLILLVLALALTTAVTAASYYVYTQIYLPSVERGSYEAADNSQDDLAMASENAQSASRGSYEAYEGTASEAPTEAQSGDYHVTSNHYEFDLPEYWRGRVTVVQDGDDTTIYAKAAYDAGYELPLARFFLENSGYARIRGDISNKAIYDQEYGGDQSVFAWAHTPCFVAYYGYHNDGMSIEDIASRYYQGAPTDLLDDYLDLSSGGSLGIDDMTAVHSDISELSCYAQYALPPLIQVNP